MKEELIGKRIRIISSNNKSIIGKTGVVVDETKNMLFIEKDGKEIRIIKDQCVFEIEGKTMSGEETVKNSEERIKK